jgi:hypothetical protein
MELAPGVQSPLLLRNRLLSSPCTSDFDLPLISPDIPPKLKNSIELVFFAFKLDDCFKPAFH